jgi:hypothetical protein
MDEAEACVTDVPEPPATEGNSLRTQPPLGRWLKALRVSRGLPLREVGAETGLSSSPENS